MADNKDAKIDIKVADTDGKGVPDIEPPSMDVPYGSPRDSSPSDAFNYGLRENRLSDPYLISQDKISCCEQTLFNCCRMPLYLLACIWGSIKAIAKCLTGLICCRRAYRFVDDDEFCRLINDHWPTCYLLQEKGNELVVDTTKYGKLESWPGYAVAGCLAHFHRDPNTHKLICDSIDVNGTKVLPSTKDEWKLAKMYVLTGIRYMLMFAIHPHLHFPQEAFIAISRRNFQESHVLRQLMEPHFQFMRPINVNVMVANGTVLNSGDGACCCWDAQTTSRPQIQGLIRDGGRLPVFANKAAHPVMQPFYDILKEFVTEVVRDAPLGDYVVEWGNALRHYIGYPYKGRELLENRMLIVDIITDYIFRVSIWHSLDHYGYSMLPTEIHPMKIRTTWKPDVEVSCCSPPVSLFDNFKDTIYTSMFVKWWNNRLLYDTRLVNASYGFESDKLKEAASKFRRAIWKHAEDTTCGYNFPVNRISKSIEW